MRPTIIISLVLVLLAGAASAGDWIEFESRTPSGPSELMAGGGTPVGIRGRLTLPEARGDRFGAMVVMHGSGGIIEGREDAWAERLNAIGLASFVVDSFTPRGIRATGDDQSRLPLAASVSDALHALTLLAQHPAIDPERIGIMGFSKGGQVALYTALEPFRLAVTGPQRRFALHIALYASCSIPYKAGSVTGAPLLLLLGGADEYTPAAHCDRYADWFRAQGTPTEVIVFPGAHHGFDLAEPPRRLAPVQSARHCGLDIELEPVMGRRWDGTEVPPEQIAGYLRGCMQRGATFGGDPQALAGAIAAVQRASRQALIRP